MMKRREFITTIANAALAWPFMVYSQAQAQREGAMSNVATLKRVRTPTLEIAYEEAGPANGTPVMLMHGFPYDVRAYDGVVPLLAEAGLRTITPYIRGYGPTRFLSADTLRSGQQAAFGNDLKELLDALNIPNAALVGYDWGGRAACVVAALWPERARCLVTANGYNIQNIAENLKPRSPEQEHRAWYQYYLHTERGREGLAANRKEFTKFIWRLWSPNWKFDDATHARTAASFDNPDFVDVVVHSYRHRYRFAPGDPGLEPLEERLAAQPPITVPTISLVGGGSGLGGATRRGADRPPQFTGPYQQRVIPVVGHNIPQEAPKEVAEAVLDLLGLRTNGRRAG
jgi:pimeloyl-ACP methyl ester carboxylesterase